MERFASNRIRASIGAVLLAGSLAGCGGDDTSTAATPSTVQPTSSVGGGAVTLSLTPPTENIDGTPLWAGLNGYRIYWGTSIGQYPHSVTIQNPGVATYVVENLSPATWYFVATVVTTEGVESDFSDALSLTL